MRQMLLLIILIFTAFSCKTKSQNFNDTEWVKINSKCSYYIAKTNKTNSELPDSITISFVGRLNDDNTITHVTTDSLFFVIITDFHFGKFAKSEMLDKSPLKTVIDKMAGNSECFLRWQDTSSEENKFDGLYKMTIFFREATDSSEASQFAKEIASSNYFNSYKYISKDEAKRRFLEDDKGSEEMFTLLAKNPLPSSLDMLIKPNYFNQIFLDSLKKELLRDIRVSDILYSEPERIESIKQISLLSKIPFIIKIKS